ncbi:MAG: hypothetical protein DRN27_05260 [Thermoplasmata archaeon]|nr:MAG: hypothetical protein DRN27_05260 [Thermoplasmata archaeon]
MNNMKLNENKTTIEKKHKIHVAVLMDEPIGWGSGKHFFHMILDGYQWSHLDRFYEIVTTEIFDKDIINGKLLKKNYDVLLVPGGGVGDGEAVIRGINFCFKTKKWKEGISNFIKDGGGYIGICGGAALITELLTDNDHKKTLLEKLYDKSAIGVSCVKSYYKSLAVPLFYPFQKKFPEHIGMASFVFSFAPGETKNGKKLLSNGVPIDFPIDKENPLFSDQNNNTIRMRWWGGPALIVPNKPDRTMKILAKYPSKDITKNEKTEIYAWRYIGGLRGMLNGCIKSLKFIKNNKLKIKNLPLFTYYFSGNWEKTNKKIDMNFQNKALITTEIYPNENKGRILLCGSHPEYFIWNGGKIKELDNNGFHCLAKGLHQWTQIDSFSETAIEELTHTWWLVRRMVAWTANIRNEDMPPKEIEILNEKEKKILETNVFWNHTLLHQIQNI